MSKYPEITVLMPVFNAERDLCQAIDSILSQTFTNFEFLIIDDGSVDKSYQILASYHDSRIRLERNEKNIGLVATLNKGISLAKGAYIARMDNDDISLPNRLEEQYKLLEMQGADIAGCQFNVVNSSGVHLKSACVPLSSDEFTVCLANTVPFAHGSVMIKKSFLQKNKLQYGPGQYSEDYDLWTRMYENGANFVNCKSVLFSYREHPTSLTKKKLTQYLASSEQIRRRFLSANSKKCSLSLHNLLYKNTNYYEMQVDMFVLSCRLLGRPGVKSFIFQSLYRLRLKAILHGAMRLLRKYYINFLPLKSCN